MTKCGFCGNGDHDKCPGGVRNGDGTIVECTCGCELAGQPRCTDCHHRDAEDIGPDWTCIEKDGCQSRVAKRQKANPTLQMMRKIQAELARQRAAEAKVERKAAVPKVAGACRCCGKKTKGGKFLPGHDSRFLTGLVQGALLHGEQNREIAYSISPAFGNKFDRRVKING